MEIKTFIEKAEKGGYKPPDLWFSCGGELAIPQMLLDPKCWRAIGKVQGWQTHENCDEYEKGFIHCTRCNKLSMIDALADGKTIEEYIATL